MNKYKAGGRCVSTTVAADKECSGASTSGALASLLAAREQQDRMFAPTASASAKNYSHAQSAIIVKELQETIIDKKACIDVILGGDL